MEGARQDTWLWEATCLTVPDSAVEWDLFAACLVSQPPFLVCAAEVSSLALAMNSGRLLHFCSPTYNKLSSTVATTLFQRTWEGWVLGLQMLR
jgi:hypothetical protein